MRIISTALVVAALAVMWMANRNDHKILESVKDGKAALHCHMQDGWRQIPAEKIEAFDGARWVFTNGSASSCKVLEVGK